MTLLTSERAPAKINLCLFLGPTRADGRHELVTLFDSLTLCDELKVISAHDDEVICEGVQGPNLVTDALRELRAAGWDAPPVRVLIRKRIPVAAGMGGGSADAAAMLRLAPRLAPISDDVVQRLAAGLGADVPSQLRPGPSIGTGAGEIVKPVARVAPYGVLVLPQPYALSTPAVYREADRLGLARPVEELAARGAELAAALPGDGAELTAVLPGEGAELASALPARGAEPAAVLPGELPASLIVNDLQPASLSLAPAIGEALAAARGTGADHALVCGSGPTVIGLFWGRDGVERARWAQERLRGEAPRALIAGPSRQGDGGAAANE